MMTDRMWAIIDDHEARLRALEYWRYRAIGGGVALGVVVTVFVWFVDTFVAGGI